MLLSPWDPALPVPAYTFYFLAYEAVSTLLLALPTAPPPTVVSLLSGAAAGVWAWLPVYPVDVVKTQLQASVGGDERESVLAVIVRLWMTGGPAIFWAGLGPILVRAVVNHASTFVFFDFFCSVYLSLSATP